MFGHTKLLSEIIGITLGDGSLGKYPRCQYLRIYFNPKQEQYLKEVESLLIKLFKKKPYRYFRKDAGVVFLEISKKDLDKLLELKVGDKIRNKLVFPKWIWGKVSFLKACIRGLFDTDGCIYVTGGKYKIINFSSHNKYLLEDIYSGLGFMGFHPYRRDSCVELGRMSEIDEFFAKVRPRNLRHYRFN